MTNESMDREKKLSMALDEIIKTKPWGQTKGRNSRGRPASKKSTQRQGGVQEAAAGKDKGPGRNKKPLQGHGGRQPAATGKSKGQAPRDRPQVAKASVTKVSKAPRPGKPIDPSTLTNLQVTIFNERAISPERERYAHQIRERDWREEGRRALGRSPPLPLPGRVSDPSRRLLSIERAPEYYTTSRSSGRDSRMMH